MSLNQHQQLFISIKQLRKALGLQYKTINHAVFDLHNTVKSLH